MFHYYTLDHKITLKLPQTCLELFQNHSKASAKNQILIIGDTVYDYEVAKSIGIDCVLVYREHQLKSTLIGTGVPTYN